MGGLAHFFGTSGRVAPEDETLAWLNAPNAPFSREIAPQLRDDGLINYETWATSWTLAVIARAVQAQPGIAGRITALTENPDRDWDGSGPNLPHDWHQFGLGIDVGFGDIYPAPHNEFPDNYPLELMLAELDPAERAIVDFARALSDAAGPQFLGVILGGISSRNLQDELPRVRQVLILLNIPNSLDFPLNVHETPVLHVSLQPPQRADAVQAAAGQSEGFLELGSSISRLTAGSSPISTATGFGTDDRVYYRFRVANGVEFAGRTNVEGEFTEFLAPNVGYTVTFYRASTNESGVYEGRTNASGAITDLGPIILDEFGGPDADGDGIPDVGEYAIGTDPNSGDSDGDGIADAGEIGQGLNPLDNRGFPTGVIASLGLPGSAEDVAVEGNSIYIATGTHGLAIVDGSRFNNPILQGQIDLPGTATGVGIDPDLRIAAVATGLTLQLIDVSDPMRPVALREVGSGATQVEVAGGLAYAAFGTSLRVVDLATGDVVQVLTLPGSGNITGLRGRDGRSTR